MDGGVKVPIGHGQTWHCFVAGHCGKVSASGGESRDMWAGALFDLCYFPHHVTGIAVFSN